MTALDDRHGLHRLERAGEMIPSRDYFLRILGLARVSLYVIKG